MEYWFHFRKQLDDNPEGRKQQHWFFSLFTQMQELKKQKETFSDILRLLTDSQVFINFNSIPHIVHGKQMME